MTTPSYNGAYIFGVGAYSVTIPNAPRIQWNAYNGVILRESVFLGPNGTRVEFPEFLQTADNEVLLGAYENIFLNHIAYGTSGTLIDTRGRVWPRARCVEFAPISAIEPGENGGWACSYRAAFEVA